MDFEEECAWDVISDHSQSRREGREEHKNLIDILRWTSFFPSESDFHVKLHRTSLDRDEEEGGKQRQK
jgi:hypothetical protein